MFLVQSSYCLSIDFPNLNRLQQMAHVVTGGPWWSRCGGGRHPFGWQLSGLGPCTHCHWPQKQPTNKRQEELFEDYVQVSPVESWNSSRFRLFRHMRSKSLKNVEFMLQLRSWESTFFQRPAHIEEWSRYIFPYGHDRHAACGMFAALPEVMSDADMDGIFVTWPNSWRVSNSLRLRWKIMEHHRIYEPLSNPRK